jgi:hypothetical protein
MQALCEKVEALFIPVKLYRGGMTVRTGNVFVFLSHLEMRLPS